MTLNQEEIQIKDHVDLTWHWTMRRYWSKIRSYVHDTEQWRDPDQRSCSSYMTLNHEEILIKDHTEPWWHWSMRRYMIKDHVVHMTLNHEEIQIKDHVELTWHWTMRRSKIMYQHDESWRDTDQRSCTLDTEPWRDTDQRSCSSYMTLNHGEIHIKDHVVHTWHWTMRRYRSKIM